MAMTDAELIRATQAILLACLKGEFSEEQAIIDLIGLYEDEGRVFITRIAGPAND